MELRVTKKSSSLAAEVTGVDLSTPISSDVFQEILSAWHENLLLIFPEQNRFENTYKIQNFNLGSYYYKNNSDQKGLNIARETPLVNYIEHLKGNLKNLNVRI